MRTCTSGTRRARTGTRTCPIPRNRAVATAPGCTAVSTSTLYRSESAGWNVEKFINVAAATGPSTRSTRPSRSITTPPAAAAPMPSSVAFRRPTPWRSRSQLIDHQMTASRFRGVRPMGRLDQPLPAVEVLRGPAGAEPGLRADDAPRSAGCVCRGPLRLRRPDRGRGAHGMAPLELRRGVHPLEVGHRRTGRRRRPTSSASCPAWPCPSAPCRSMLWDRGSNTPSGPSASTVASSPATSPLTPCTGRSMSCTRRSATSRPGLDEAARAKLFAENAERIYRL